MPYVARSTLDRLRQEAKDAGATQQFLDEWDYARAKVDYDAIVPYSYRRRVEQGYVRLHARIRCEIDHLNRHK